MKELATQLHAEKQELLRDSFILSGPHYENGKRIEGYRYYAKYVRNRKLWFSYTLFIRNHATPLLHAFSAK